MGDPIRRIDAADLEMLETPGKSEIEVVDERHVHRRSDKRNVQFEIGSRDLLFGVESRVGVEAKRVIRDQNRIALVRQILTAQIKADDEVHPALRQSGEDAAADLAVEKLVLRLRLGDGFVAGRAQSGGVIVGEAVQRSLPRRVDADEWVEAPVCDRRGEQ